MTDYHVKTPMELLLFARDLIATPDKHTTGIYARDIQGNPVAVYVSAAACWCLDGALLRGTGGAWTHPLGVARRALNIASAKYFGISSFTNAQDRLGFYVAHVLIKAAAQHDEVVNYQPPPEAAKWSAAADRD